MTEKELSAQLKVYQDKIESNKQEIADLHKQVSALEVERQDLMAQLSANNANKEVQKALLQVEEKLDAAKEKLHRLEEETANLIQKSKETEIELNNLVIAKLEEELEKVRTERELLRSELIPQATKKLEELKDRKKKLDALLVNLSAQLAKLNRRQTE